MNSLELTNIITRLKDLYPVTVDLGLDRILSLLQKLGNPQDKLPPVIHIAGTNGKGSTLSFLQSILEASGLKVHRYTSPELVRFNERYILCGKEVTDDILIKAIEEVEIINNGSEITFFEITTAIAFKLFSEIEADIVLLETGLGGRLDSTNVISKPQVCVISSISMDHQDFLGNTIAKISNEKAGIMRFNSPVVIAKQKFDDAYRELISQAESIKAKVILYDKDFSYKLIDSGFVFKYNNNEIYLPKPKLIGMHQYDNATTAIAVCQVLLSKGFYISTDSIVKGLQKVKHRGRFELLDNKFSKALSNLDVYCDGGHNIDAGYAIKSALDELGIKKIILVFTMFSHKDITGFINVIKDYICAVYTLPLEGNFLVSNNTTTSAEFLADKLSKCGLDNITACNSLDQVLKNLQQYSSGVVLCAGSLRLVGDIISYQD